MILYGLQASTANRMVVNGHEFRLLRFPRERNRMKYIVLKIPFNDWNQIESDIENMCGMNADEIEILSNVVVLDEIEE